MHKFEIKQKEKIFLLTTSGLLSAADSKVFLNDWNEQIKTINPKEFNFIQDAQAQMASTTDLLEPLKEFMKMLINTPFKSHHMIAPKSSVAISQYKRIGKEDDFFSKMILVNSYEEVLKLLK